MRGLLKSALTEKRICELESCREKMPDIDAVIAGLKEEFAGREVTLVAQIEELKTLMPKTAGMTVETLTTDQARVLLSDAVDRVISRRRGRV